MVETPASIADESVRATRLDGSTRVEIWMELGTYSIVSRSRMQKERRVQCIVRRCYSLGGCNAGTSTQRASTGDQQRRLPMSRLSTGLAKPAKQGIEQLTHADQRVIDHGIDATVLEQPPSVLGSLNVWFSVQCCRKSAHGREIHPRVRTNFNVCISRKDGQP